MCSKISFAHTFLGLFDFFPRKQIFFAEIELKSEIRPIPTKSDQFKQNLPFFRLQIEFDKFGFVKVTVE
jgi:hypothetical protein